MPKHRLLPLVLLPSFLVCGCADPGRPIPKPALEAAAGISAERIADHMGFLAGDELEGRGTGSNGYLQAAEYVAGRFEEFGLRPAGDDGTFFQSVPLLRADLIGDRSFVELVRDGKTTKLELDRHYVMDPDPSRELSEVTAPLAFVGFGVSAPGLGHDDYTGIDVRGKIAVLFRGAPASFPPDERAFYSWSRFKRSTAVEHGAVGLIEMLTEDERARDPWDEAVRESRTGIMRWLDAGGSPSDTLGGLFFSATLSDEGMELLFDGSPVSLADAKAAAAESRAQRFELPGRLSARSATAHSPLESPNVVALLPGSAAGDEREYVVITAHLDHLGVGESVDGDAIYNGAYDNASGVAIQLEVARALAGLREPPRRSLLFLAVTAEEKGLLGAEYFVEHPTIDTDRMAANINFDMVLMPGALSVVVAFGADHSSLHDPVDRAARTYGLRLAEDPIPEEVIFVRSDQFPFVRKGIPAVFMVSWFEADDPQSLARFKDWMREFYHSPADDMNQVIDFDAGATFARVNLLASYLVADTPEPPAWNPGDFFGERFGRVESQASRAVPAR